jgi:NADPH-dependent glutamate synthase beta subunit-like oxidoreductase
MRTNIPAFRLPAQVLDEEIGYVVDMGADLRLGTPVASMRELLADGGFGAVFVGTGAPKGKELSLPGPRGVRPDPHRHRLARVGRLRAHRLDRRARADHRRRQHGHGLLPHLARLGAKSVKVMARKPRGFFKASEWELEDAEEEQVEIIVNHAPKCFVVEGGKLKGMKFERLEYEMDGAEIRSQRVVEEVFIPCDDVILAIGQENAFPWVERDLGIEFDKWDVPKLDAVTSNRRARASSSAATPRSARRTSSGRSSTATRPRSRSTSTARASRSPSACRAA